MKLNNLEELLEHELTDLYSSEKQIIQALPKMAKAANSPELRRGFEEHLAQTKEHLARLDTVFDELGSKPGRKKCAGMEGLLEEGAEIIEAKKNADEATFDAALIAAAQRVEHYEIAGYGCARTYANTLGLKNASKLLQQTLNEEVKTDEKLTQLAESSINPKAGAKK